MGIFGLSKPDVEKMKAKKDVKGLIKALKYKKESSVRCAAAEALGKIGYAGAVESLVQVLNDEERDVRSEAAKALGKIKEERAVEPLIQALKDKDSDVRSNATWAIHMSIGACQCGGKVFGEIKPIQCFK